MGWKLSVPSISRKTQKGLPRHHGLEEDTFILAGAEDLVPVLLKEDGGWRPDKFDDDSEEFTVKRYRPRIEGSFTRIEQWRNKTTGEIHWQSTSTDNVTRIYGRDPEGQTRIADPEDPTRVFEWLLEETRDDKGNLIRYEYKQENEQNIDLELPEKNRLRNGTAFANRYLKRIRYGNRIKEPSGPEDWLFELVFDYGDHDKDSPDVEEDRDQPWPRRQDPFSTYRAGFEIRTYRLCQRVLMFHRFDELEPSPCLTRSTDFEYEPGPVVSYLNSVQRSGYIWDEENNPYQKKSFPPLQFEYQKPKLHDTAHKFEAEEVESIAGALLRGQGQWVDLDGEGLSGILSEQGGTWFYKRNQGDASFAAAEAVEPTPSIAALAGDRQQLLDLAGDGQMDLVSLAPSTAGFYERRPEEQW